MQGSRSGLSEWLCPDSLQKRELYSSLSANHGCARVHAVLCSERAGLHLELLHRVGKWVRKIRALKGITVRDAIESRK
jgi:hypothetical protein